jgi:cytochrome c553
MKTYVWTFGPVLAAFAVLAAAGGFAVAASGIIPIKASSGHWPITAWFLNFSKERSIATHTLGMTLPDLSDPTLILYGAGHYEAGCRPCHGSPEQRMPRVPAAMTPHPPYLPPIIAQREPEELFYVVKHGIKFTGMPGWPAQHRDDEVLGVVAFLLALPALDATSYRKLVHGERTHESATLTIARDCARCHGADGNGRELPAYPKLAGQKREYLERALAAYARGERASGMMEPLAADLTASERRALADYYSNLPRAASRAMSDTAAIERGRAIATRGIEASSVPSCMDCHGPGGQRRNASYPELAGQFAEYLTRQLELFHDRRRGGSSYAHLMMHVAPRLSEAQIRDVATYYASLAPESAHASSTPR